MTQYDFIQYWEHYVSQTDILEMYQAMDRTLNAQNQGKCVRCGNETLQINGPTYIFSFGHSLLVFHADTQSPLSTE